MKVASTRSTGRKCTKTHIENQVVSSLNDLWPSKAHNLKML